MRMENRKASQSIGGVGKLVGLGCTIRWAKLVNKQGGQTSDKLTAGGKDFQLWTALAVLQKLLDGKPACLSVV